MAKIRGGDVFVSDGEKLSFVDDSNNRHSNIWWNDTAQELSLDTVISGVYPTKAVHLTTRQYVDDEITTLSGSMVLDHGGLTGLGDDDHTQYILVDGSRGFTSTVSGVTPIQDYHLATKWYIDNELATISGGIVQDHGNLLGLSDDDHTQYILADGTRAFTGTVSGITPTEDAHLATKQYVDDTINSEAIWEYSGGQIQPVAAHITDPIYHGGSLTVAGDLVVSGTTTTINSTEVTVEDKLLTLNYGEVGAGVSGDGLAGIEIDRGSSTNYQFLFQESTDTFEIGEAGNLQAVATREDSPTDQYIAYWNDSEKRFDTVSGIAIGDIASTTYTDNAIATLSGSLSTVAFSGDHGDLTGLDDDDHTQYILVDGSRGFTSTVSGVTPVQDYHLATKGYIDTEISGVTDDIATLSGSLADVAFSGDHGDLTGLSDDDHTQYILVDGSRGFTATVSGVYPTQDYHLATKEYVDEGGIDLHGRATISDAADSVTVNFSDLGHENYTLNVTMGNTSDSPPSMYSFIETARTSSSFTVSFSAEMDSANYYINWTIIED